LRFTSCEFEFLHAAVVAVFGLKPVRRKASTVARASSGPTTRAPKQMMFALLCSRASAAETGSLAFAARMPGRLFAAMLMPMPVPQMRMPSAGRVSLISRAVSVCATSG
jgi:hypothetical protein